MFAKLYTIWTQYTLSRIYSSKSVYKPVTRVESNATRIVTLWQTSFWEKSTHQWKEREKWVVLHVCIYAGRKGILQAPTNVAGLHEKSHPKLTTDVFTDSVLYSYVLYVLCLTYCLYAFLHDKGQGKNWREFFKGLFYGWWGLIFVKFFSILIIWVLRGWNLNAFLSFRGW